MLEGNKLILATRPYASDDAKRSWTALLVTLVLLISSVAGTFILAFWPLKILCSLITSLLIVRMFVIYHDYLHRTILQKSILANVIFTIFGYLILCPKSIWRRSHDYHHDHNSKLHTASIGSFPIATKEKYLQMTKPERAKYLFIRHPLTIGLGYIFAFAWGITMRSLLANPIKHWDSFVALIVHYGVLAFVWFYFGWQIALISMFIPIVIATGIGSLLFYVQHNFPDVSFEDKEGWTYVGAALNSSSLLKMSRMMHWFTANIGYHHIHHINARIPFYRLPEVFRAFPEFQNPKTTSLNPIEIIRCLNLKVWDPISQRMLTLREVQG